MATVRYLPPGLHLVRVAASDAGADVGTVRRILFVQRNYDRIAAAVGYPVVLAVVQDLVLLAVRRDGIVCQPTLLDLDDVWVELQCVVHIALPNLVPSLGFRLVGTIVIVVVVVIVAATRRVRPWWVASVRQHRRWGGDSRSRRWICDGHREGASKRHTGCS